MILIADSGSTKTDWMLKHSAGDDSHRVIARFQTQGINPIHMSDAQISSILNGEALRALTLNLEGTPLDAGCISSIHFYGSGVRADQEERMVRLLGEAFGPSPATEAHSDLLGAARALCGRAEGLACILGTGSNSCLFDGSRIVANTPPLGYILGDEGSGAVLGKLFLNALYKGVIGSETKKAFEEENRMTLAEVIERVYRQPLPNRWLASLSPFIHSRLSDPAVEALVTDSFSTFIARNIDPYRRRDLPINAVGSIAFYYKEQLCQAAAEAGYAVGRIVRSPLECPCAS